LQPERTAPAGLRRKTGWAVADQALSSATNVAITVLAARTLDPAGFGAFSLVIVIYLLAVGISRGFVTEPLLSRPVAIDDSWAKTFSAVTGGVLPIAAVAAAVVAIAATFASRDLRMAGLMLAVALPGLLVQDAWRFCFMAQGRPAAALVNDATWAAAQATIVGLLASTRGLSLFALLLAWAGGSAVAAFAGAVQASARPSIGRGRDWLRSHVDIGGRYTVEFLTASGAAQLGVMGLGAIAGLPAVGAVRAAQTLFGPINIVYSGMYLVLVPAGAALARRPRQLARSMVKASVGLSAFAAAWTLAALLIPERVGRALFGTSWDATDRLVLTTGALVLAGGLAAGGIAGLRALAAAKDSLHARLVVLPLVLIAPLAGAAIADARGYTLGLAAATAVGGAVFWQRFRRLIAASTDDAAT
jgi:O-antigen/teichoic acid export membrane protein